MDRDFLETVEIHLNVHMIWFEIQAGPRKVKHVGICVRSRLHVQIYNWHHCVINLC
jgi:hypothetical protein